MGSFGQVMEPATWLGMVTSGWNEMGQAVFWVALLLTPALVGWLAHARVDALGWANYILLAFHLGLGTIAVIYFFAYPESEADPS